MNIQDLFVGGVALITGIFIVASAIMDTEWLSKFWLSRRLGQAGGASLARGIGGLIGLIIAVLGVLLMLGAFSNQSRDPTRRKSEVEPWKSHNQLEARLFMGESNNQVA